MYAIQQGDPMMFGLIFGATALSTDGGQSWTGLNGPVAGDVLTIAPDPRNPGILYVLMIGTSGVFRSTDGGATWNAVNAGLSAAYITALVVDGQTPSTVYAATQGTGVCAITFAPQ